jgi:hypothetical protein
MLKFARAAGGSVLLAIALLVPQQSYADLIAPGSQLNIVGSVSVFVELGTGTVIDFGADNGTTGDFLVLPISDGTFDVLGLDNTTGTILDLNETDHPSGPDLGASGTGTGVGFMTFAAAPSLVFDLNVLLPGNFGIAQCLAPAAAGQVCTPPAPLGGSSPFELINTSATSSIASFQITGTAFLNGQPNPFTGSFSATFNDIPYQTLLGTIFSGGVVTTGYDAEFNFLFIPEPSTMNLMLGTLFVAIGVLGGKKLRARR